MNDLEYCEEAVGTMPPRLIDLNDDTRMKYNVQISQLDYGYVVNVGCKSFAVETPEKLLKYITEYINNPGETEKKFYTQELF